MLTQAGSFLPMTKSLDYSRVLAANVTWLLKHHDMEVGHLEARSGISRRTIQDVKSQGNPRLETITAIADVFRLSPTDLLDPNLPARTANHDTAERVKVVYETTSQEGREILDTAVKVAERMRTYNVSAAPRAGMGRDAS